jgi:hypothetical protein
MSYLAAELRKLLGLPSAWVGLGLSLLLPPGVVLINGPYLRKAIADGTVIDRGDLGYTELMVGVIGALVLGVVAVSSEYSSGGEHAPDARQLTTSLVAMPHRLRFLAAKAAAVSVTVAAVAAFACAATMAASRTALGDAAAPPEADRLAGVVVYWVLMGLLACGLTVCFRNGVVPLTVLILNSSVVSVSFLLSQVTDAAVYLPDVAGARMFVRDVDLPVLLSPLVGGLTTAGWVAAVLAGAAVLLRRRDA